MKTTIDIADGLLAEAKERATEERATLRELVERGLRAVLAEEPAARQTPSKLLTRPLEPLPGVDPYDDWDTIREEIYERPRES